MYVESMTLAARRLQLGESCLITMPELVGFCAFNAKSIGFLYEASSLAIFGWIPVNALKREKPVYHSRCQPSFSPTISPSRHITKPQATRLPRSRMHIGMKDTNYPKRGENISNWLTRQMSTGAIDAGNSKPNFWIAPTLVSVSCTSLHTTSAKSC